MKCWIVSYRWLDIPNTTGGDEFYWSEAEAIAASARIVEDERGRQKFDPASVGQFEVLINVFTFEGQLSRQIA